MFKAANVTIMVKDMKKAVAFYTESLGLALKAEAGHDWAEVGRADLTIGLHTAGQHGPQPGSKGAISVGFEVDNLEAGIDQLKKKGVQFAPHLSEEGAVRLAFFADPDGNPLYIWQAKAASEVVAAAREGHVHGDNA